jgi:hypothetical protein
VQNHIEVVQDDPAAVALTGRATRNGATSLQLLTNMLGNGSRLPLVCARTDHKEVGERTNLAEIEGEGVACRLFLDELGNAQREVERRQDPSHLGGIASEGTALAPVASP